MSDQLSVYLVRHAIAAERGSDWPDDTQRPLTSRGAARFRQVVAGLAALGVSIDEILTSPLVRAQQTADLLAQGLTDAANRGLCRRSRPTAPLKALLDEIATRADREALALVGHEPGIGELAARLTGRIRTVRVQEGRRLPHRLHATGGVGRGPPESGSHRHACCGSSVNRMASGGLFGA